MVHSNILHGLFPKVQQAEYLSSILHNEPWNTETNINPYPAEFLKWKNPPSIFGTIQYYF